ncbi:MAG: quinone-dependent dihydroorotate dehydrogenase [Candidatus Promineofilum sp.]|nr:quinone-dependent dihydroorotate dehydrogenase [Promineifilum sp.]MBP9657833.1 quinone-dependent dihydroorotate dehydrogenase [Promineifilum sp.]
MTRSYYERLLFPAIRHIDAETAHDRTLNALALAQSNPVGRAVLRSIAGDIPNRPVQVGGLHFPNVLGMAAGFDKDARVVQGLALLGYGHIETGTLTPRPQPGNPRPRVFRLPADEAVINRMGFPNGGVEAAVFRLRALAAKSNDFVLGVSLGKQKETPLAEAAEDYMAVMRAVHTCADYLAVNISSPNTPGLRELQGGRYLEQLLHALVAENRALAAYAGINAPPLWVKIAPDLEWHEIDEILEALMAAGVDGIIATNTTLARDGLSESVQTEAGGLSGRPLRKRATDLIAYIHRRMGDALPIIGVGGISSAADAREKLDAGASVVQLYTGMIYGGPGLPGRILRELAG